MIEGIEKTLDTYRAGGIDRRRAVQQLLALAGAAFAGGSLLGKEPPKSTFAAKGLNHIALRVTDIPRSRDFYEKHLGLKTTSESEWNCFMDCGDDFVALFKADKAGMDHYCYTIDDYDASAVVERLKAAGLKPTRQENRVYFPDPDGLTVQLAS